MKPSDLQPITTLLGQAHQTLARPCPCVNARCRTIGEHVWRATADARPGPRAAALDGTRTTSSDPPLPLPEPAGVNMAHHALQRALEQLHRAAGDLLDLTDLWRPDRATVGPESTPDDWCTHHLTIGVCEPRYRGSLCRRCYDFSRAERILPTDAILHAWHRGDRVTVAMVAEAKKAAKAARKRARRKKGAGR